VPPDPTPAAPSWVSALQSSAAAELLRPVSYEADTVVARAGELGDHFLVITAGSAQVTDPDDGAEVATVGAGSIVGELALLTDGIRTRDVTVVEHLEGLEGDVQAFDVAMELDEFRAHVAGCAAHRLASFAKAVPAHDHQGRLVLLRPLLPSDREAYLDALAHASRQTLVSRFFGGGAPSRAVIDYLLDVDYVSHFAWVALEPEGPVAEGADPQGAGVGVARYIRDRNDPTTAEWAVAVTETHRRRGVASLLLGALGVTAVASGIETLTANVLADNVAMRALLDEIGATWERVEPGVVATSLPAVRFAALFEDEAVPALEESIAAMTHAANLALA